MSEKTALDFCPLANKEAMAAAHQIQAAAAFRRMQLYQPLNAGVAQSLREQSASFYANAMRLLFAAIDQTAQELDHAE